ncbi:MAG: sugar phosphate nucleotidyltransferase [Bacilli bacterium]|jgi:mannose-1-phosphate guanylyltransferase
MNIVILSGGSGKRLWPLSNDIQSKQFLKIFRHGDEYESMVQRIFHQIRTVDPEANITIATSKSQVSSLKNQLMNESFSISVEPLRKDTFPAILLTVAYLKYEKGINDDEPIIVCPVDPYVDTDYFKMFLKMLEIVKNNDAKIALMGIMPTYPSEKYGYVIPSTKEEISSISYFKEKPSEQLARDYIGRGALWNGGVFAFKIKYVLDIGKSLFHFIDYKDLLNRYSQLERISFDYAVVEKEPNIKVIKYSGHWKDLGTWNTLTEATDENIIGDGTCDDECQNTNIVNKLNIPILAMGLKNTIISASPNGILVTSKDRSSYIKSYVEALDQRVMFAEKSWGDFLVLAVEENGLVIRVNLKPGKSMNYHMHKHRDESWVILSGNGFVIIDGKKRNIHPGDSIYIERGTYHTVQAGDELIIIEVQIGEDISIEDKHKKNLPIL